MREYTNGGLPSEIQCGPEKAQRTLPVEQCVPQAGHKAAAQASQCSDERGVQRGAAALFAGGLCLTVSLRTTI